MQTGITQLKFISDQNLYVRTFNLIISRKQKVQQKRFNILYQPIKIDLIMVFG